MSIGVAATLASASVRRHPARTALAVFGVAVAAAMLLDMVMLSSGMRESFRALLEGGGFEIRLTPRGTLPFDTDATVRDAARVAGEVRRHPDVLAVAPVLGASLHVEVGTRAVSVFGLGVDAAVQGDYTVVSGRDLASAEALVANDAFATTGLATGSASVGSETSRHSTRGPCLRVSPPRAWTPRPQTVPNREPPQRP